MEKKGSLFSGIPSCLSLSRVKCQKVTFLLLAESHSNLYRPLLGISCNYSPPFSHYKSKSCADTCGIQKVLCDHCWTPRDTTLLVTRLIRIQSTLLQCCAVNWTKTVISGFLGISHFVSFVSGMMSNYFKRPSLLHMCIERALGGTEAIK